jgi:hypothetical protein
VIVQVASPALATPTPLPPNERWSRPSPSPAAPVLAAPASDPCRPGAPMRLPPDNGCEPLVLARSSQPTQADFPLRSVVIVAELLASVAVLRWALR